MTQEEIAAMLVARGWALRLPYRDIRCWKTIELKAVGWGRLYVLPSGEIRAGYTLRASQRVGPQTRRRMLREEGVSRNVDD